MPPAVPEQTAVPQPPPEPQFDRTTLPKNPKTFEEYMLLALHGQLPEMRNLMATLAHADATNRMAQRLEDLNEFLGVYDEVEADSEEEAEPAHPRFADVISEGVLASVDVVKDDILSKPLVQMVLAMASAEAMKATAAQKQAQAAGVNDGHG